MNGGVFVASAVRTPIGRASRGSLAGSHPAGYGAAVIEAAIGRAGMAPDRIDALLLGCGMPEGATGGNIARTVAVRAGLIALPATTISVWCASGLEAVTLAAGRIASGEADALLAGGIEAMSKTWDQGLNERELEDPWIIERYPIYYGTPVTESDHLARTYGLTREAADAWALMSHRRAAEARDAGRFDDEIMPVALDNGGSLDRDECIRADTTAEALSALKIAGGEGSVTTAGNASQRGDGAAACMLVGEALLPSLAAAPLGRIVHAVSVGLDPQLQLAGPTLAVPRLLERAGLGADDIDLWEIHEAFGCQLAYCVDTLGLNPAVVNVDGGAIALGHPFGMTGTRLVAHILRALRARGGKRGVIAMCCGGGMGFAMLVEAR